MPIEIRYDSPVPVRVQLADQLRAGIISGEYPRRLPSVSELATRSGLSPTTVQAAIRILKDEGLVYGARGRGIFVRATEQPLSAPGEPAGCFT